MVERKDRFKKIDEMLGDTSSEQAINNIPLDKLIPSENNPFNLYDEARMSLLKQSISDNGVITPIIVRVAQRGKYTTLAGHNRVEACKQLGLTDIPAVIKYDISDEEAMLIVVETNIYQRSIDTMLPSELAKALDIQLNMLKCQGKRNDLTSCQMAQSNQQVADKNKLSARNVARYIRLNSLIPELLDMVDLKQLGFTVGVELSYLTQEQQIEVLGIIRTHEITVNGTQAKELREIEWESSKVLDVLTPLVSVQIPKQYRPFKDLVPKSDWVDIEDIIKNALKQYYEVRK